MGTSQEFCLNQTDLVCLPGQRLSLSDENTIAGQGTYERLGYIYSTLAGTVNIREEDKVLFYFILKSVVICNVLFSRANSLKLSAQEVKL